ncbi:MAG: 30S ribosomal protein S9 [Phycisphaerae bacterium]|nr:30S ribosomal protein S9 [Phycisphaerae bacterium]
MTEVQGESLNIETIQPEVPKAAPAVARKTVADRGGFWWGTGRRKSSVARVRIKPGSGKLMVNRKELTDYFRRVQDQNNVLAPLKAVDAVNNFDVFINVKGGGTTGQSGASLLGMARALKNYDENYLQALRDSGHLTRDPRMVERKKPGQKGARKRFQFSKR